MIREYDIAVTYAPCSTCIQTNLRDCPDYFMSEDGDFYFSTLNGHNLIGVDLVPEDVIDDAVSDLRRADYDYRKRKQINMMNIIQTPINMRDKNNENNRKMFRAYSKRTREN